MSTTHTDKQVDAIYGGIDKAFEKIKRAQALAIVARHDMAMLANKGQARDVSERLLGEAMDALIDAQADRLPL